MDARGTNFTIVNSGQIGQITIRNKKLSQDLFLGNKSWKGYYVFIPHLFPDTSRTWSSLQFPISEGKYDSLLSLKDKTPNCARFPEINK